MVEWDLPLVRAADMEPREISIGMSRSPKIVSIGIQWEQWVDTYGGESEVAMDLVDGGWGGGSPSTPWVAVQGSEVPLIGDFCQKLSICTTSVYS